MKSFKNYLIEKGLWYNIHMKRKRGERMRKKGEKGAPTQDAIRSAQGESVNEADPKVGTGKKPKGSDRRLYTDENPKDTVSIKFATPADAKATVAKVKNIKKPYARKIQILTVGEQRAKVMGKSEVVSIFKKAKQELKAAETKKNVDENTTIEEKKSESWEAGYKRRVVKTTKPEHKAKGYEWRIKGKERPEISIKLYKNKPSQAEFNNQMRRVAGHEFGSG